MACVGGADPKFTSGGSCGVIDCLYRRLPADGSFQVFESTDGIQHGSPPLALMTKAIEEVAADTPLRIGRLTLDILGAIPVAPVKVRAWTLRRGCAHLTDVRRNVSGRKRTCGGPGHRVAAGHQRYQSRGGLAQPARPLGGRRGVNDVQRLAMVVDSANGAALDPNEFVFMNTDTTVHPHRVPIGTDFGLRARASIGPDGVGITTADLFDRQGFVGTCAQTLLVFRRCPTLHLYPLPPI
jgi:hypothetical protein